MIEPHLRRLHVGQHGLRGEELVLEIDGNALVPILGCHLFAGVAIIARRIVDEDGDRPQGLPRIVDCSTQGCHIAHVTALEIAGRVPQARLHGGRGLLIDIDKGNLAFLPGESGNDGSANAAAAPGHEDDAARKGRIDGVRTCHGRPPVVPSIQQDLSAFICPSVRRSVQARQRAPTDPRASRPARARADGARPRWRSRRLRPSRSWLP